MPGQSCAGSFGAYNPTMRRFRLDPGLQELLSVALAATLEAHSKLWTEEIAAGEIGEETRAVLVAFRYVSSGSDPRLTEVGKATRKLTKET